MKKNQIILYPNEGETKGWQALTDYIKSCGDKPVKLIGSYKDLDNIINCLAVAYDSHNVFESEWINSYTLVLVDICDYIAESAKKQNLGRARNFIRSKRFKDFKREAFAFKNVVFANSKPMKYLSDLRCKNFTEVELKLLHFC